MRFVSTHVVHPYSSTDSAIAREKSRFILSERSDFHMIHNLLVDEILLPMYVNLLTNFRGLP